MTARRASVAVVCGWLFAVGAAGAEPSREAQAKRLFEEGVALEKRGDFAAALAKFEQAETLKITAGLRFHKGYALEELGRLTAALEAYEVAENLALEQGRPEVQATAGARIAALRSRVAAVVVRGPAGSPITVRLDDRPSAPAARGEPVRVDPGDHVVHVEAEGQLPFDRTFTASEGAKVVVDVIFPKPAVTATPAARGPAPSLGPPVAAAVFALGLAGVGVSTLVVTGHLADDARASCPERLSCADERRRIRNLDLLALGGFVGAAGLGALSVVLFARHTTQVHLSPSAATLVHRF